MSDATADLDWRSLMGRPYPSTAFYTLPSIRHHHGSTALLAILLSLLIIIMVILLLTLRPRLRRLSRCRAPPPAPRNVQAGLYSPTQFIVRWDEVSAAESYTVYTGQVSRFGVTNAVMTTVVTRPRAIITGLPPNRNYYVVVTATNTCGQSPTSSEIVYFLPGFGPQAPTTGVTP
jgi:hypothetical protein